MFAAPRFANNFDNNAGGRLTPATGRGRFGEYKLPVRLHSSVGRAA